MVLFPVYFNMFPSLMIGVIPTPGQGFQAETMASQTPFDPEAMLDDEIAEEP